MVSVKKSGKRILIAILIAVLVFTLVSFAATKLVYDRIFVRYGDVAEQPEGADTGRQRLSYYSGENRLVGYLYRAQGENRRDGLIVLAPGFHAGADDYAEQIEALLGYGWSVFAFDPTGSCASEGDSAVGFVQELYDVEQTLEYIENNDRFGYNDLILFGHSRGGYASACALRSGYDISAVVCVSAINSAMDGVMSASVRHVGNLAYAGYGFLWLYQGLLFDFESVNLNADQVIEQSNVPVLIVHGAQDEQVPPDRYSIISHAPQIHSERVEYYVGSTPEQDGHTNILFDEDGSANDRLMARVDEFLTRAIQ